jgi:hypothetical protein
LEEAKQIVPERLREIAGSSFANKDKGKGRRWRAVDDDDGPSAKRAKPSGSGGGGAGFSGGSNSWGNDNGFSKAPHW